MSGTSVNLLTGTDARLVEGLRAGEEASYRHLYEMLAPRLQRTLERVFRDPSLARDAVQASFFIAFRRIEIFDGRSSLSTWLTRIALREAARLGRPAAVPREDPAREAWAHSPEEAYGTRELAARLRELIDDLPVEKRVPLVLFELEELSVQEIADLMHEPRGTILARLSRTRAELREAMSAP
jgi:RNA polymerase sigma-70 factor, ECF subfamily